MRLISDTFIIGSLHFGGAIEKKEVSRIVDVANSFGINNYETAPLYGNGRSISTLANVVRNFDNVGIFLKYGLEPDLNNPNFGVKVTALSLKNFKKNFLTHLETFHGKITCFSFHAPHYNHEYRDIISHLNATYTKINIGVANFSPDEIEKFRANLPEDYSSERFHVQFQANLFEQKHLRTIGENVSQHRNIAVLNRCLCRGLLTSRLIENNLTPPIGSRAQMSPRIRNYLDDVKLKLQKILTVADLFAKKSGISVETLSIAYLLETLSYKKRILLGVSTAKQLLDLIGPLFERNTSEMCSELKAELLSHFRSTVDEYPYTYFER